MVPQRYQYVVERNGRFSHMMEAGFNLKVPLYEMVAYKHSLKE